MLLLIPYANWLCHGHGAGCQQHSFRFCPTNTLAVFLLEGKRNAVLEEMKMKLLQITGIFAALANEWVVLGIKYFTSVAASFRLFLRDAGPLRFRCHVG